jgi:hypothetical protein
LTLGDDYDDDELDDMISACGGENGCITFDNFKSMMLQDMKSSHGPRPLLSVNSLKALISKPIQDSRWAASKISWRPHFSAVFVRERVRFPTCGTPRARTRRVFGRGL